MAAVDCRLNQRARCHAASVLVALALLAPLFASTPASAQYAPGTEFTQQDMAVRVELVAAQENLLNIYRCRFDVDTQIVPGGCANRQPAQPPNRFIAVTSGTWHSCGLRVDNTITCWGSNNERQLEAPSGEFTAITAGSYNSCGIRPDNTLSCWGLRRAPTRQYSAVSAGDHTCAIRTQGHPHLLGREERPRPVERPHRKFHCRLSRRQPFVRHQSRRFSFVLGQ